MSAAVVSAAVAAGKNTKAGILASPLANPFKRQRRMLDEGGITEETPLSRSEDTHGRAAAAFESQRYGTVDENIRLYSNSPPKCSLSDPYPRAAGQEQGEIGSGEARAEIDGHDYSPQPEETDDDGEMYILTATPYRRLIYLFALVPLSSLITLAVLLLLLHFLWPSDPRPSSYTSYLGLSVFSAATWIVSFALRIPLYQISCLSFRHMPTLAPFMSTLFQVLVEETLRFCSIIFVHIRLNGDLRPSDPAFSRVWALAVGWAIAEVTASVWQGFEQLSLYKDVLSPDDSALSPRSADSWTLQGHSEVQERRPIEDPESLMNEEIEQLIRIRSRVELEAVYGIPVPNIPVSISCLQRIDSIILSLALFLVISSKYLSNLYKSLPFGHAPSSHDHQHGFSQVIVDTLPVFFIIVVLHTFLSFIWTADILPRIGIHTASYTGCVVALGTLFAGLGQWGAL